MTDGWPPRTARFLTAWTVLLLGLVLVEIRHLPPVLAALLVPYLVLMAWHGVAGLRRRPMIGRWSPRRAGPNHGPTTERTAGPALLNRLKPPGRLPSRSPTRTQHPTA